MDRNLSEERNTPNCQRRERKSVSRDIVDSNPQHSDAVYRRLLRRPEVLHKTGLSRSALYRLIHTGDFPPPVRLSQNAVAWRQSDVDAWIDARVKAVANKPTSQSARRSRTSAPQASDAACRGARSSAQLRVRGEAS